VTADDEGTLTFYDKQSGDLKKQLANNSAGAISKFEIINEDKLAAVYSDK
jgi:hypothetical protein